MTRWSIALPALAALVLGCRTQFLPLSTEAPPVWLGTGSVPVGLPEALAQAMTDEVNRQELPGLQVCIGVGEQWTWFGAAGTADPERREPLGLEVTFRMASMTKMFTAVVVERLVELGSLSLDGRLSDLLPEARYAGNLTIAQLLGHTAGLPEILRNARMLLASTIDPTKRWTAEELGRAIYRMRPVGSPGEATAYSNTHYIVLGLVAERVTGRPLADLYSELIYGPLGLTSTAFVPYEPAPSSLVAGFDYDYLPSFGVTRIEPTNTSWATMAHSSGAMVSRADQVYRFVRALFDGEVIGADTLARAEAFVPYADPDTPEIDGVGLGLFRFTIAGERCVGHLGSFIGFGGIALYVPESDVVLVVLSNRSRMDAVDVASELLSAARSYLRQAGP